MAELNKKNNTHPDCGREITAPLSRTLIIVAFAPLFTNLAHARTYENSVPAENAAIYELLRSDTIGRSMKSFCLEARLPAVDENTPGMFAKPINDTGSPESRGFRRDLKTLTAKRADLRTRNLDEVSLRGAGFNVREATDDECAETLTVRLHRPMASRKIVIVFASLFTKCATIPLGVSFHLNEKAWVQKHIAYYYSVVGPPGCSFNPTVVSANPTDKLYMLERAGASE
ncbi:hypothetical protein WBP06_03690 [Novosphingobium sp. BL-8H]|uniref:hypothetical protein n=1 Tax=Novosphingobium sp. BL-8H TaxID=3127640 RepID=UPI0037582A56